MNRRDDKCTRTMSVRACVHTFGDSEGESEPLHPLSLSPWAPIERTHRFPFAPGLVPCRSLSALIILEPINHLTSEPPPATSSLSRGESPSYPDPREGSGTPACTGGERAPSSRRYAVEKSPGSCGLITMFRNNVLCHAVDCKLFGYKKDVHLSDPRPA